MKDYEERLWQKAKRAATLLQLVPFVRFVAVTGSLGRGEAKPDSDADLFIVTEPGRLYTARAFALAFLQLIGQRINVEAGRIAGAADPNYWLTADNLDIAPHSAFVARDYTFMVPLWDASDIYFKTIRMNVWVSEYKRKFRDIKPPRQSSALKLIQYTVELFCRLWPGLEAWMRSVQESRIRQFSLRQGSPEKAVLTDRELRLHL